MNATIETELSVSISINGTALSNFNSQLQKITITESISDEVARVQIDVLLKNEMLMNPIIDGSLVELGINFPEHIFISHHHNISRYRVYYYDAHEVSNEFGLQYTIVAIPEAYYLLNTIEENAYSGTAHSVFASIAKQNKIDSDLKTTNDTQVWFSADGNKLSLLRHTCLHAWKDMESVYCWWIDRYGVLCLKNFTDEIKADTKWVFIHNRNETSNRKVNEVLVHSIRYMSESGANNTSEGYGQIYTVMNPIVNDQNLLNINTFYSGSETLNVNKDLSRPQRYDHLGIQTSNTHPNYLVAELQNKRGRTLYSIYVECYSNEYKDVLLGDTVYYEMSLGSEIEAKIYTGKYIIIGIETVLLGRNTMTKYTLAKQGVSIETKSAGM